MCGNPAMLANISTGMQAFGAVAGAGAAFNSARAQREGFEAQAQVARNNAQLQDWQAQDAIRRGQDAEQQQRLKVAGLKGSQRAALAANGFDLTEGSAVNLLTDTDLIGERDALTIRDNAVREAWGYRVQSANLQADAQGLASRGRAVNPIMAAGTTLLTGAGAVSERWLRNRQLGITGY